MRRRTRRSSRSCAASWPTYHQLQIQLMAEIHAVHFSDHLEWRHLGGEEAIRPRDDRLVDARAGDNSRSEVADVMSPGIVHPGQWAMTRRDVQLTWLIRFAQAWIRVGTDSQPSLIRDPWAMKSFAEAIPAEGADASRLALLHLSSPDTFEAVVSVGHRKLLIDRFGDRAGYVDDPDRKLLEIRANLSREVGEDFNWYDDPLVHLWLKPKAWRALLGWTEKLRADPGIRRVGARLQAADRPRARHEQTASVGPKLRLAAEPPKSLRPQGQLRPMAESQSFS